MVAYLDQILPGEETTVAEVWAASLDESNENPSHAVARKISCPAKEGAETAQWLFEVFPFEPQHILRMGKRPMSRRATLSMRP